MESKEQQISVKGLVYPTIPFIMLVGIFLVGWVFGVSWNIHGGGGMLIGFSIFALAIASVFELILVPKSVVSLISTPSLRTKKNILSVIYGSCILFYGLFIGFNLVAGKS